MVQKSQKRRRKPAPSPVPLELTEMEITWGTTEEWGKLVVARPVPLGAKPTGTEDEILRALFELKTATEYYRSDPRSRLEPIDDVPLEHRDDTSPYHRFHWNGWDLLVLPRNFARNDIHTKKDIDSSRIRWIRDSYDGGRDNDAESPGHDLYNVFMTLRSGHSVLVYSERKKLPGFIPAVMSTLAEPECHVAKVVYPLLGERYELTPLQIGYLAGLYDARFLRM